MRHKFHTDEYVASHGMKPKGKGSWAFSITGKNHQGGYTTLEEMWFASPMLTLTEAKQAAKRHGEQLSRNVGGVKELIIDILP